MGNARATIKDVARMANVSTATVSHVLNNTRFVSPEVKQRVMGALEETNYSFNNVARALRSSKTNNIGVIIPDITNPFFAHVVKYLEVVLNQQGYNILLCHSRNDPEKEMEQLESMRSGLVDGVIIAPASSTFDYSTLPISKQCPMIFIDRRPMMKKYNGVFCNIRDVTQYAIEQLILAGHTRIACMLGQIRFSITYDRKKGYLDALEKHNIPVRQELILSGPTTAESGYEMMEYIMRATDATAVFAANGKLSLGAMHYLNEHDIAVPGRMAIIGLAAYEWSSVTRPALTSVLEPLKEMGLAAANLLLELIREPERPEEQIVLDAYLTKRTSY